MRSFKLLAIVILTVGLMMLTPAMAVKGSYPGKNGMIAFSAGVDEVGQIWVMNADGTGLQQLTHGELDSKDPAWSPGGTEIVYTYGTGADDKIWVMNADGSNPHALTSGVSTDRNPAWSPDETKIAFARKGGGIYVMNADGTGTPTQLTANGQDYDPAWSPDGTKIAFVSSGQVWVLTVGGSASQLLTKPSTHPCWSPDGSKIAYEDSTVGEIWVVDADGSNDHSTGVTGESPNWSPDGAKIAYFFGPLSIHVMNADGSGVTDLTPTMPSADSPDWQRLPEPSAPVGGFIEPVNRLALFAPYLALLGVIAAVAFVVVKPRKKRED
jgi:Tol biopolymer transport system component